MKSPPSGLTLSSEAVAALVTISEPLKEMTLTKCEPTILLLVFNSAYPTFVVALYQPRRVLGWLQTSVGGTHGILTEVDTVTIMTKKLQI